MDGYDYILHFIARKLFQRSKQQVFSESCIVKLLTMQVLKCVWDPVIGQGEVHHIGDMLSNVCCVVTSAV